MAKPKQGWIVAFIAGVLCMIAGLLLGKRATEVGAFHVPILLNIFGMVAMVSALIVREEMRLRSFLSDSSFASKKDEFLRPKTSEWILLLAAGGFYLFGIYMGDRNTNIGWTIFSVCLFALVLLAVALRRLIRLFYHCLSLPIEEMKEECRNE
jgi:hypothetical protein